MRIPDEAAVRFVEELFQWLRTFGTGAQAFFMVLLLIGVAAIVIVAVQCLPKISADIADLQKSKHETQLKSKELDLEIVKRLERLQRSQEQKKSADENRKGDS